jgi:hypothetical protein
MQEDEAMSSHDELRAATAQVREDLDLDGLLAEIGEPHSPSGCS